jgi:hypothetical protein
VRRRLVLAPAAACCLVLALPPAAWAHGLVGRQDLPIPRWLFSWGAAAVLVASFVALAALWRTPQLEGPQEGRRIAEVPKVVDVLAGLAGIGIFVAVVYAGLSGSQTPTANLAPTVVYVLMWVGIPFLSILLGDVFRALSPWRAVARGAAWLAGRVPEAARTRCPRRWAIRPGSAAGPPPWGSWPSPGSSSWPRTARIRARWPSWRCCTRGCSSWG